MNYRSLAALALVAAFSLPLAANAATTATPVPKHAKSKGINASQPGSPGYTGSSKKGSATKAAMKKAKKKSM